MGSAQEDSWLPATGHWLLVSGCWPMVAGYIQGVRCQVSGVRKQMILGKIRRVSIAQTPDA